MTKIHVPPIKIQGIKTKIVPYIQQIAKVDKDTTWTEPFMGSGVVGFNMQFVNKLIFGDINPFTISFYNSIKNKTITKHIARAYLEEKSERLLEKGADYYYEIREQFNNEHNPLDFLFLNRSCFNGMIRFNKYNKFNVPFCQKPNRFDKAYISKIVNQIQYIEDFLAIRDVVFVCQSFAKTIQESSENTFFYCDPPYIGRHVDYFDTWDETSEKELHDNLIEANKPFILSTWDYNQYRRNEYIDSIWAGCQKYNISHFYFIGAKESNRNSIMEALLTNYQTEIKEEPKIIQTELDID